MRLQIILFLIVTSSISYAQSTRAGLDRALFFAVSDYQHGGLTDLSQPILDARAIAQELEQRFGFETEIVQNPSLVEIQTKLADYQQRYEHDSLPSDGQLFIFFSGHGVKDYGNGYFLPSDAKPDNVITTGLAYNMWRPFIDGIRCQHILVAVDACYSVTFDPNWQAMGDDDKNRFSRKGELSDTERIMANYKKYPSRLFFTSDAQEDIVPGRSNFARKLLDGLANSYSATSYLSAQELFAGYIKKALPTPNAGDFGKDDVRSNFLFFYQSTSNQNNTKVDRTAWEKARSINTALAFRQYLQQFPTGEFRPLAEQRLSKIKTEEKERLDWEVAKRTNTKQGFQDFINRYPNSIYHELAALKEEELSIKPPSSVSDNMVFVEGGTYIMGCQSETRNGDCYSFEKPAHEVTVSSFYIGRYEVTNEEFIVFLNAKGNQEEGGVEWVKLSGKYDNVKCRIQKKGDGFEVEKGYEKHPVIYVNWYGARAYCRWLSEQTGKTHRLPTEAEWEYAARGGKAGVGDNYKYSGSDKIKNVGWYYKNSEDKTHPVGRLQANQLGLYDMSGNVCEWCADPWHSNYNNAPKDGRIWLDDPNEQVDEYNTDRYVTRGGSWAPIPGECHVWFRESYKSVEHFLCSGFRVARE